MNADVTQDHNFPEDKRKRLLESVTYNRRSLGVYRKNRRKLVRQYVGKHYSDAGTSDKQPLGLLEMAVTAYIQAMAGGLPQALITARNKQLRPIASSFESALNQLFKEIDLAETIREAALDAMFSMGIVKVGLIGGAQAEIGGYLHDVGQPFAEPVSLDDWVHDTSAKRWEQITFCGNIYRMSKDMLHRSGLFDVSELEKIEIDETRNIDETGEEKTAAVGGKDDSPEDYKDQVRFIDLWLPEEKIVLMTPFDAGADVPSKVIPWQGPEGGCFRRLCFSGVPDNIMPLSPLTLLEDLHVLANQLFVKLGRQARRQKSVMATRRGAGTGDAQTVMDSGDGDVIGVDNPQNMKEMNFGGVSSENFAFLLQSKDLFSWSAGNLDTLAGLSPQSETVGQEKILNANSNRRLLSMSKKVSAFVQGIMSDLGHYLWKDPITDIPIVKRVGGLEVPSTFGPSERESDFYEHQITINPYSLQQETPEMKLQKLLHILTQVVVPLTPFMQQQGLTLNVRSLLQKVFRFSGQEDLDDIILDLTAMQKAKAEQGGPPSGMMGGGKPAVTERNYTRRSIPGASRAGKDGALMQTLMGGNPQAAEKAAMGRPTG